MKNILIVCLVVVILVVVGAVTYSSLRLPQLTTYTDSKAGFSLKYPAGVLFNDTSKKSTAMVLSVSADKLSDIPEDLPMNQGRASALAEKARLAKGEGEDVVHMGPLNAAEGSTLAQFEECSVIFSRSLTFYPGDYRVRVALTGPVAAIKASMPEFFVTNTSCQDTAWDQKKITTFLPTLAAHKGTGAAQKWYDTFDEIVKTVTVTP